MKEKIDFLSNQVLATIKDLTTTTFLANQYEWFKIYKDNFGIKNKIQGKRQKKACTKSTGQVMGKPISKRN